MRSIRVLLCPKRVHEISGVPQKCSISTSEQNCGPAEELPMNMIHPDKYTLRQYLVDKPDAEMKRILHIIRHQNHQLGNPTFRDQRSIVFYRNRQGWTAWVIHDDHVDKLCEEAIATSPWIDDSDEAILRPFEEFPSSSVQSPSCATHLPKTTINRRFSKKLQLTARHLRWVALILSDDQKATRVQCSRSILTILRAQETRDWHDIMTLDESWFYYITDYELILFSPDGEVPDRERVIVQSESDTHYV
jgi:hypothetical protein